MSWAAVAVAGGAVAGGLLQSESASKASGAQTGATNQALRVTGSQDAQNRADLAPYRSAGQLAVRDLMSRMGLAAKKPTWEDAAAEHLNQHKIAYGSGYTDQSNQAAIPGQIQTIYDRMLRDYDAEQAMGNPNAGSLDKQFTVEDFMNDPVTKLGYESGLREGTQALDRMAGARGMRNSGATLKGLTRFGQDYSGQKAGDSYNRFYADQDRTFNRLSGLAGTGQTATTNTASLGAGSAGRAGDLISAGGNARGAAAIAQGNAFSQGLNTVGSWWNQNQLINQLNQGRGGFGGFGGSSPY